MLCFPSSPLPPSSSDASVQRGPIRRAGGRAAGPVSGAQRAPRAGRSGPILWPAGTFPGVEGPQPGPSGSCGTRTALVGMMLRPAIRGSSHTCEDHMSGNAGPLPLSSQLAQPGNAPASERVWPGLGSAHSPLAPGRRRGAVSHFPWGWRAPPGAGGRPGGCQSHCWPSESPRGTPRRPGHGAGRQSRPQLPQSSRAPTGPVTPTSQPRGQQA